MKQVLELEFDRLVIRRWAYRAAWLLLAVIVAMYLTSAWSYGLLEQRLSITATLFAVPAVLLVVGGVRVGWDQADSRFSYDERVEARRPICIVIGAFVLLVQFVLALTSLWVNSHAGDLAQTAVALVPVTAVALLMAVNWDDF